MKKILFTAIFASLSFFVSAQNNAVNWSVDFSSSQKKFIENKGQFDGRTDNPDDEILFAVDHGEQQIFFTKTGVTYRFQKVYRNPNRPKGNRTLPKRIGDVEYVHFKWEGANANVELKGEILNKDYHVYAFTEAFKTYSEINNIRSYQKLVYKNLYPNIDVEYVFHPDNGIKYSLIVHPGGDVSKLKMSYPENTNVVLSTGGKLIIPTMVGEITEHEPHTFYAANSSNIISSNFLKTGNTISFQLGNYDRTQTIVVDPWVQTPALNNTNCVWEVEVDGAGNAYIIGGDSPMRLQKYNAAGVLQWTHNTPYTVNPDSNWLGTLATDRMGNSYVTNGSSAALQKINTNGSLQWNAPTGFLTVDEFWNIAFNCDQTKLIIGGTTNASGNPLFPDLKAAIFDVNTSNGSINAVQIVASGNMFSIPPQPALQEVRSITSSYNAKYYFLTHDTIGVINQDFAVCGTNAPLFKIDHGYKFGYKCENYRPNHGNGGIMAIRANKDFLYSQNGATIHKRSLIDGSVIATAAIPGGINNTSFGLTQAGNSGIAIDNCGNIYVGSGDRVIKYDSNLNLLTSVNTAFRVYDVAIAYNGEVLVAGATGNNSNASRTGYVQSINMSACNPDSLICCNASLCPIGPYCTTDAPVTLSPAGTSGGTWAGPGMSSTGIFNPATAGPGNHIITYTLPCGSDQISITVNACATLAVCLETNGNYTVSGGFAPYTWEQSSTSQDCSGCTFQICGFPPGCEQMLTTWTSFGTGTTVTPPGTFPIRVRDNSGNILLINSAAGIPQCSTTSCPTLTFSITSQTNVSCFGANNGSATVNVTGGTGPYTYSWQPGNLTGATRNNLAPGTYTIVATDANSCTVNGSVTIIQPTALTLNSSQTPAGCAGNDGSATVTASGGTPGYTYAWSNGGNTATISGIASGAYAVTVADQNNCTATATVTVSSSGGVTASVTKTDITCNGANNGTASITTTGGATPISYVWSNGAVTQNLTGLSAGNYTATVTDNAGCVTTVSVNIAEPSVIAITGSTTNVSCGAINSGTVNITVSGGTPPYTYSWSNGQNTQNIDSLTAGSYTVVVSDANNCNQTGTYTVAGAGVLSVSASITDASCAGVTDGSISLNVTGGSTPYTFAWSNGASSQNITNISGGTYTVTVTDANQCVELMAFTVGELTTIAFSTVINNVNCEDDKTGSIKLLVFGGSEPYNILWNTGGTTDTETGLSAGPYTVTVTDANGCIGEGLFNVTSQSNFTLMAGSTTAACDGSYGGTSRAFVEPSGAYTYIWSRGDTTWIMEDVDPGMYVVTVTDQYGCSKADTTYVSVAAIDIEFDNIILPSCPDASDGAIEAFPVGGSTPYTYLWSNGEDSKTITALPVGVYRLTVTDQNDCVGIDTFLLVVDSLNLENCIDSLILYDVFTPNGDGKNDIWIIDGLEDFPDNEVQIFNRWGSLVFEAKPYQNNWDGRSKKGDPLPSATYYYILKLNDADGRVYSGHVTIVR